MIVVEKLGKLRQQVIRGFDMNSFGGEIGSDVGAEVMPIVNKSKTLHVKGSSKAE